MNIIEKEQILRPMFNQIEIKWNTVCIEGFQGSDKLYISIISNNLSILQKEASKLNSNIIIRFFKKLFKGKLINIEEIEERVLSNIIYTVLLREYYEKKEIKDRKKFLQPILKEMKDIMSNKSHDYAESGDVLSNFKMCEKLFNIPDYTGISIRLSDKLSRIKQITSKGKTKVKDESLQDTLVDTANYSLLFYLTVVNKYDPNYRRKFNTI